MKTPLSSNEKLLCESLRSYAEELQRAPLPYANLVWLRAERRARREAIDRASRPLGMMRNAGLLAAGVATAWVLSRDTGADTLVLLCVVAAALAILAGCGAMLYVGRHTTH